MLKLKVTVDSQSGFCYGVVKAIQKAESSVSEGQKIFSLGHIVHNEQEVGRLASMGLTSVEKEDLKEIRNSKVLIRAHGEPPETYRMLKENANEIVDATCPIVLKIQDRVRKADENGECVLIFGKPDHPEVVGLVGQTQGRAKAFTTLDQLNLETLPKKVTLFSQTTMALEAFYEIRDSLVSSGFEVVTRDTVCRHVSGRKDQLRVFSSAQDAVVFVSGTASSNGKVLYEVCASANPRCHKVVSPEDLDPEWFRAGEKVGVCGATSTPVWLMEAVASRLRQL